MEAILPQQTATSIALLTRAEVSYRILFNANFHQNVMTKVSTNFRKKNLPNAALLLANSAVNIRLAAVAAAVLIANEPICNIRENEETSVIEALIRIGLIEYRSSN